MSSDIPLDKARALCANVGATIFWNGRNEKGNLPIMANVIDPGNPDEPINPKWKKGPRA